MLMTTSNSIKVNPRDTYIVSRFIGNEFGSGRSFHSAKNGCRGVSAPVRLLRIFLLDIHRRACCCWDGVAALVRDTDRRLWVASNGKVASLQNGRLSALSDTNDGFTDEYVQGICASRDGGLWVATPGCIRKWRAGVWSGVYGTNPCASMITAMTELKSGGVAFGAVDSGLCLLTADKKLLCFGREQNFPHEWIRSLYEDREGTLWVGAGNAGVVALRAAQVEIFSPPDHWQDRGSAHSVTAAHDGALWVTTEGAGVYRFFNGAWRHFGESNGLPNQFAWCVSEDAKSNIWAGTWGSGMFVL